MGPSEKERNKREGFPANISLAVERLVKERLGLLEDAVLLGNKFYRKPTLEEAELLLQDKVMPHVNATVSPNKSDLELGETVDMRIDLQNVGKAPVLLARLEEIAPSGFELVARTDAYDSTSSFIDMHGKRLNPYETESLEITLRPTKKGTLIIAPKITFVSETGRSTALKLNPSSINVSETVLPSRVTTGFQDLDRLLLGGIPQNYAMILTSASCDERDLLIRRFLEAGVTKKEVTFYVTIDAAGVQNLAEEFQSNFYVFVCNPNLDETLEDLPNVFKLGGVENLTEMDIGLESAFRKLGPSEDNPRRACLEIVSDVLLQHHAVQTRRWLTRLIPELRSRGFTTLAVMNPNMHAREETHAVLDMFEGELSIYEKETQKDTTKYLRIRKLYNERYLESELPLRKTRLMTTPLRLPCCTRSPNV